MARSPIQKQQRWYSGVVLRHCAAAVACAWLTVDEAVAAAYCTPGAAAQIRPADGFLHNHCPNSSGFTKRFNMAFYSCGLPFFHRKLFFLPCALPIRSYSVGGSFDYY